MERITSRQNPLITRLRRLGAEKKARLELVKKAVEDLTVEVDEPTVF